MQTLDYIPRNIFSRTRHPPKDVRIYTLEGPEFLLINLISRKNIFRPLHQSPRNLIIPDKIACFRKHTSKDLSAHTTPSSPSSRRMTSLIKIPISEKEIFNVSPLGTGVNDLSSLRTIPPQSWRIVSRDHHPKATHRFQLSRWRLELLHCGKKKKKANRSTGRTVSIARIQEEDGLFITDFSRFRPSSFYAPWNKGSGARTKTRPLLLLEGTRKRKMEGKKGDRERRK